jgi:hypothetical protein
LGGIDLDMARAFYLHISARLDSDTVFYKIAGEEPTRLLVQLFTKQYAQVSEGLSFSMTPEDAVPPVERILLEEALTKLEIYDDPDPWIYDPPPTQETLERAHYARQAGSWERFVTSETQEETCPIMERADEGQVPGASEERAKPTKVFISYSHDSEVHCKRVLELSNQLRAHGVDCHIDQYEESPPAGWPRWCDRQVREAVFVLVACTQVYLRRFRGEEEQGKGLGGTWEGHIITQELYNAQGTNTKFLPILFAQDDMKFIPNPLQGATHYQLLSQYDDLYRRLTRQPKVIRPTLGDLRSMPPVQMPALPELKTRKSFFAQTAEKFKQEETIRNGGEQLYNELIAENFISHSVAGPRTVPELIEEIARHSNLPIPIESITAIFGKQPSPRGHTFFGNPGDYLEEILGNQPKVRWWISRRGLNVHAETGDGKASDRSQQGTEPESGAMNDEITSPEHDKSAKDKPEDRELVACAEYETKVPGAEFVYSEEAKADVDFPIAKHDEFSEIIRRLKVHDWFKQGPAIEQAMNLDWSKLNQNQIFVLGRNIYQCALGKVRAAEAILRNLRGELAKLPTDSAIHMLNGMFFEVYFNREGRFRGVELKDDLLCQLLTVQAVSKFEPSVSFIHRALGPYKSRLVFAPSTVPKKVAIHLAVDESIPPVLKSFNLNGVELLVSVDDVGDFSPRSWWSPKGTSTLDQLEKRLTELWRIPAAQISIDCDSTLDRSAVFQVPKDFLIQHPGSDER